jgi:hypothetical protein
MPRTLKQRLGAAVRGSIATASPAQRVAFVHVPKCGGTSVYEAAGRWYPFQHKHIYAIESFNAVRNMLGEANRTQLDLLHETARYRQFMMSFFIERGVGFVSGHAPLSPALMDSYPDVAFLTMLRDPVDRYISHYRYDYLSGNYGEISDPLDHFIRSRRGQLFGRMFAKYFSGLPVGQHDHPEACERAIDALRRFAVVGFVADLPRFEQDVSALLNRPVRIPHRNKGSVNPAAKDVVITQEQMARIREICEPDIYIYATIHRERMSGLGRAAAE